MGKQERIIPECPKDAHKVIRPPVNEVRAELVVKIDLSEIERFTARDVAEVLAIFSAKPKIAVSNEHESAINEAAMQAEIMPAYLEVNNLDSGFIRHGDGSVSNVRKIIDCTLDTGHSSNFLTALEEPAFLIVDTLSMLTLRSISTVYPWDSLLASDFLRQYHSACSVLGGKEKELLYEVRYGLRAPETIKDTNAFPFLKLERKLFLQYPVEDD